MRVLPLAKPPDWQCYRLITLKTPREIPADRS
jgi:hypothetical protein